MVGRKNNMEPFEDIIVVYRSDEDTETLFVAHSMSTDQVGVGTSPVDAFVELILTVRVLVAEAESDPSVQVFVPAPVEIMRKVAMTPGREVPDEMWEQIMQRLKQSPDAREEGYWEEYQDCDIDLDDHGIFFRQIKSHELMLA